MENTTKDANVRHLIAKRSTVNASKEEFLARISVSVKIVRMENVIMKLPSSHKTSKMFTTVQLITTKLSSKKSINRLSCLVMKS